MAAARLHGLAGVAAFVVVCCFLGASLIAELLGNAGTIARVKHGIVLAVPLLVAAMAVTGASGWRLAGGRPTGAVGGKFRRMRVIGGLGLLVLVPCAVVLDRMAAAGDFGALFVLVQGLEFAAGATNLVLIALNARDGLRLRGEG